MSDAPAPAVLEARHIVKHYGRLLALDDVNFDVRAGEVHALVGENGAGKSTLMSLLYGVRAPDSGSIFVDGGAVRFAGCAAAIAAGIGMVFQHFALVERFTAAENVLLGLERARLGFVDRSQMAGAVRDVARRYGFGVDPEAHVESLGVGARQQVELLKVLERDARIVILDEPTASLSPYEAAALFDVLRTLRSEGRAIVLVSHKLKEVLDIADRITVLRAGKIVGSVPARGADLYGLAEMMVGRRVDLDARVERAEPLGESILQASDLSVARDDRSPALKGVNFGARAGEIVGIAGVEGNGQIEFAESLYGLRKPVSGRIVLGGRDVTDAPLTERRALGMRYIPPDRVREGLVLEFDARENVLLGDQRRQRGVLLDLRGAQSRAEALARAYSISDAALASEVATYSGGMQQKLIVGRELASGAILVIACAPTRGVDVGAAETIHAQLRGARDGGAAVLLISYDLDEIRALADRIVVFAAGRIAGELAPKDATDRALGRLMSGAGDAA